jgi:hypothetical protein
MNGRLWYGGLVLVLLLSLANLTSGIARATEVTINNDQYCCRGAYGTQETCVVSEWPALPRLGRRSIFLPP